MPLENGVTLPVLDIPGRCLVLALHALASGYQSEQVREDLRRARFAASPAEWQEAGAIAEDLGILQLFHSGIHVVEPGHLPNRPTVDAYLKRSHAVGGAFALQRLAEAPLFSKPGIIWQELFPSWGFMARLSRTGQCEGGYLGAYWKRWKRLGSELPSALRVWRQARGVTRHRK